MPAWPVSTSTMPSSGTCFVSSPHMRSGRIGTASDSSAGLYFAYHSLPIERACSTQGLRIDVDLDGAHPNLRDRPEVRGHASGFRADEAHQVRLADDAVRALARIRAAHAHRKRMHPGNRILSVERGGDGNGELHCERDELLACSRCAHSPARDDDGPLG